jgi:hypothetical protein
MTPVRDETKKGKASRPSTTYYMYKQVILMEEYAMMIYVAVVHMNIRMPD